MIIDLSKVDKNVKKELFGEHFGLPYEQTTPEWNIKYYKTLLKYTKKTVLRNKHIQDLKWWEDSKAAQDRVRQAIAKASQIKHINKLNTPLKDIAANKARLEKE